MRATEVPFRGRGLYPREGNRGNSGHEEKKRGMLFLRRKQLVEGSQGRCEKTRGDVGNNFNHLQATESNKSNIRKEV